MKLFGKVRLFFFILLIFTLIVIWGLMLQNRIYYADACENEYPGIIRLHVIANSNQDFDQELKLKVRDRLLCEMEGKDSIDQARSYINANLSHMEDIAEDVIAHEGYSYSAKARLGVTFIPEKSYDDITLPAGRYEALTVTIGSGKGHNWWCVIFPQLCIPESYTESEKIEIKSKIMEIIHKYQPEAIETHE